MRIALRKGNEFVDSYLAAPVPLGEPRNGEIREVIDQVIEDCFRISCGGRQKERTTAARRMRSERIAYTIAINPDQSQPLAATQGEDTRCYTANRDLCSAFA
jgi:hypothetical protein